MLFVTITFDTDLVGTTKEDFVRELGFVLNDSYACGVKVVSVVPVRAIGADDESRDFYCTGCETYTTESGMCCGQPRRTL